MAGELEGGSALELHCEVEHSLFDSRSPLTLTVPLGEEMVGVSMPFGASSSPVVSSHVTQRERFCPAGKRTAAVYTPPETDVKVTVEESWKPQTPEKSNVALPAAFLPVTRHAAEGPVVATEQTPEKVAVTWAPLRESATHFSPLKARSVVLAEKLPLPRSEKVTVTLDRSEREPPRGVPRTTR